jgi:hypothetical protein
MSSFEQITSLFGEMTFADKLAFMAEAQKTVLKEGKSVAGKPTKSSKKAKEPKETSGKKRDSSGTQAWNAFIKKCQVEHADRLPVDTETGETSNKRSAVLQLASEIKKEDLAAYELFVKEYKETHSAVASDAEASEEEKTPAAAPPAKKVVAKKAESAAPKKAESAAPKKAESAAPKKAESAAPKKPEEPKISPAAAAKAKAAAAKAKKAEEEAAKKRAAEEEEVMVKKIIDGEEYFWCKDTNGLWKVDEGDAFGPWVGYYQAENAEDPIRFTDAPGEE